MRDPNRIPIVLPTTGKVDKDTSFRFTRKGDQVILENFEFSNQDVGIQKSAKGNSEAVDFGSVSLQNQTVRIQIVEPYPTSITINIVDQNGYVRFSGSTASVPSLDGVKDAIQTLLLTCPYPVTFNLFPGQSYMEATVAYFFNDYTLTVNDFAVDITKEAISQTGVGNYMLIGSFDLLNNYFVWLTTQREERTPIGVPTNAVAGVNNQIQITRPNHGLQNFESVAISGIIGVPEANGIYTVQVVDANNFILLGSSFSGAFVTSSNQSAYKNIYGYGCIGVVQYSPYSGTTFIPLLRSKKLNFVTTKQIYQPQMIENGGFISGYYTDDYNVPRKFYYKGPFIEDGALRVLFPQTGYYAYATLSEEVALQVQPANIALTLLEQQQTGGNVPSGGARYAVVFKSETGTESEMTFLSDLIPVYTPLYEPGSIVYGTIGQTGKINRVLVEGIVPGIYKSAQLIYYSYASDNFNSAVSATFVREEPLAPNQTAIILEHNGNEPTLAPFDATLAAQVQPSFRTAKDLVMINNRLVVAGYTVTRDFDLSAWVDKMRYSLKRKTVPASTGFTTENEFYDPANTKEIGYAYHEWVRFYVVARSRETKKLTNCNFFADVRFVSTTDYDPNEFISTNKVDKRVFAGDELVDYSIVDSNGDLFQLGIELKEIDWNFLIDGVPAKDLFDAVYVFRAEVVPEVLATGVYNGSYQIAYQPNANTVADFYWSPLGDYSLFSGLPVGASGYTYGRIGGFYSPDLLSSPLQYEFQPGDEMISYGPLRTISVDSYTSTGITSSLINLNYNLILSVADRLSIVQSQTVGSGGATTAILGVNYFKRNAVPPGTNGNILGTPVFLLSGAPSNFGLSNLSGLYRASIFRSRKDKYGAADSQLNNVFTGAIAEYPATSAIAYGGDVFTQSVFLKKSTPGDFVTVPVTFGGVSYRLIAQNRFNENLRLYDSTNPQTNWFPAFTQNAGFWLGTQDFDSFTPLGGYSSENFLQTRAVFSQQLVYANKFLKRKAYSLLTPNGSNVDLYPVFLPLDFQDNPDKYGNITGVVELNNELFTVQELGFTREYFNSRGRLQSSDQGELLIGDGSVLSRIGDTLTSYGTTSRGSIVRGFSKGGKPILMWVDTWHKVVVRFGSDGIVPVSELQGWRNYFNENLTWAQEENTPANGSGISGVWDNRNKQFIYTVKAWKRSPQWSELVGYGQGDTVEVGFAVDSIPQLYVALADNQGFPPATSPLVWRKVDLSEKEFYNVYSFTWSEIKDCFTQSYTDRLPNIFIQGNDKYFTPNPNLESPERSKLYLAETIEEPIFYGTAVKPRVKLVMNDYGNNNKKFAAVYLDSQVKPERVDVEAVLRTEDGGEVIRRTFMTAEDFIFRTGYLYAPVKLNLDLNGDNEGDESQIEGIFATFDITFPAGSKVVLKDFGTIIRVSNRNYAT